MKSKLKAMFDDDRGVSPVIGVILMVAITVILAAVIGTFVLGLGDSLQQAPQTSASVSDASNDYSTNQEQAFVISHQQGDPLTMGDMRIVVRNASDGSQAASYQGTDGAVELNGNAGPTSSDTEFTVGDSIVIDTNTTATFDSGYQYQVQVIHVPSDTTVTDSTVTLQ